MEFIEMIIKQSLYSEESFKALITAFLWDKTSKNVSFTNGCYDILHIGHISGFEYMKLISDVIVIGINSDTSVKQLKGNNRPIFNENVRAKMIESIKYVDLVIVFNDLNPCKCIEMVKPKYHFKGEDYDKSKNSNAPKMIEEELCKKLGIEIKYIPLIKDVSTTNILKKLK